MAYTVKKKGKYGQIKKAQYYVQYLGWKECRGLGGREFTEPIVKDLVIRRQHDDQIPKLTIEVGTKELKIYQLVKNKWGRTDKLKFPTVPAKDVTYATQGLPPDDDIVACIYLGYNPTTRRAVHVHVYRCDSPETAAILVDHLSDIVKLPDHQERLHYIEKDLAQRGEVTPRPRNFINTYDGLSVSTRAPSTVDTTSRNDDESLSDDDDDDSDSGSPHSPRSGAHRLYDEYYDPVEREKKAASSSLARELQGKLDKKETGPLLLPPQDYDTVRRKQGDLKGIVQRKCLTAVIVGSAGATRSAEKDSAKGDSDSGSQKNSVGEREEEELAFSKRLSSSGNSQDLQAVSKRLSSSGNSQDLQAVSKRLSSSGNSQDLATSKRLTSSSSNQELSALKRNSTGVGGNQRLSRGSRNSGGSGPDGGRGSSPGDADGRDAVYGRAVVEPQSADDNIHVVSPRWKAPGAQVYQPPSGHAQRPRSPSPPPGARRHMSPHPADGHYDRPGSPSRRGPLPPRPLSPRGGQVPAGPYSPRGRSPSPRARGAPPVYGEYRERRGLPRNGDNARQADDNGYGGYYGVAPPSGANRQYPTSADLPPPRQYDDGYRSIDRRDVNGPSQYQDPRNQDSMPPGTNPQKSSSKKDKKKNKKNVTNPGDDLPIDYTLRGKPSAFKYMSQAGANNSMDHL